MNKVIITGRLTKDPEVKYTASGNAVCSFSVATDRRFKGQNGERQTDYINCVAWRQLANVLGQYFHKGSRIGLVGNLQTRQYDDQNGRKVNVTEVIVDEIEFVDTKADAQQRAPAPAPVQPPIPAEIPPVPPIPEQSFEVEPDDTNNLPFDIIGF